MPSNNAATEALARPVTLIDDWTQLPADSKAWVPGQRLGPYRLQRQLGKGGMGVVWLAEQLTPLQREVAIKLLPPDPGNPLTEVYFEVERQALAQLSHRSIAQIFDAGRLPDGALFFAMEYVAGAPLDAFLMDHALSLPAIVRLLVQICRGAHHAHQRALIHRDLKPLNILVQMVDGEALPKIIDFGLALGTLPGSSARLEAGKAVGTPGYMSPEQKIPSPAGIDARSDVYALGAILGQCLCWHAGVIEPGHAVDSASLHAGLQRSLVKDGVAGQAELPVGKLQAVPQDLRAIALQALAQDREQRYDSAAAMADDLTNWLQKRPVRAMGSSRWYAVRCFVNRHRLVTAAATAIVLALMAGVLMAMHGMRQAREAQALAEQRRDDAERLIQFMLGDFADKLRPIGRLDLLDGVGRQALAYLSAQTSADDPVSALSRARALRTLGEVRVTRQQFDEATKPLAQAAAILEPWLDQDSGGASDLYFESGTIAYWRGAIDYRLSRLDQAEAHWRDYLAFALRLQASAPLDPRAKKELAAALSNLGTLAEGREQFTVALDYFRQSSAIQREQITGPGDRTNLELANALSWISRIHNNLGEPARAWLALEQALQLVSALRRETDDNQLLQRETNLHYLLGMNSRYRDDPVRARQEFDQALTLARLDVRNDPSQPRRQAMLARISFEWVRARASEGRHVDEVLAQGRAALSGLPEGALATSERLSLEARACLAQIGRTPAAALAECRQVVWPALWKAARRDFGLLELAAELATAMASQQLDGPSEIEMREILRHLTELPESSRLSLSHALVLRALLQQIDPAAAQIKELSTRIDALRASFADHPLGV